MSGVNKVTIIGNLGADPEVRQLPNGGSVTSLRIATSEKWKDKQTGQQQERTEWHSISFFGRPGEIIAQYCSKGSKLYVEGSLRTRKWQDQSGADRYSTDINGREFQFLSDNRPQSGGEQQQGGGYPSADQGQYQQQQTQQQTQQDVHNTDIDDDIPF